MVEDWIAQCRLGDYAAMEALVKEFSPKLYQIAYSLLGNAEDAEEATEKAFIRIFRSLVQFRGDFSPELWMSRIQIATCKDFLRAHGSFRPILPEDEALLLTEPAPVPANALAAKDLPDAAFRLLNTLPTDYMVMLFLCDIKGFSQKEAALTLDLPLDGVSTRLFSARQLLFLRFSAECTKDTSCPTQNWQEQFSALSGALCALTAPDAPEGLGERVWAAVESTPEEEPIPGLLYRIFASWQIYVLLLVLIFGFTFIYILTQGPRQSAPRTNPYITDRSPISTPAFPFGPVSAEPSPSPSPTAMPTPTALPDTTAAPVLSAEPVATPYAAPTNSPTRTPLPTIRPLSPSPTPAKKPTQTPTPNPPAKVYSPVSSLTRRGITFVVKDPEAEAIFQSAKSGGVSAVREAFAQNDISYSVHETVLENCSDSYNALVNEANALAQKIANGQFGNLRARLVQKESEMEALKNRCATPSLSLSYD